MMPYEVLGSLLISISAGIGAYVAIRVDLARLHERINHAHDKINHAHERLDFIQDILFKPKD